MHHRKQGFISIRGILAIFIIISIIPLSTSIVLSTSKLKFNHDDVSDELALLQLRRILNISYDLINYGDHLEFIYHDKNFELALKNKRLVLSPGYQMFLNDVDDLYFKEEGNTILIEYYKKGKEFSAYITTKNGIYLDDFLNNDDSYNLD